MKDEENVTLDVNYLNSLYSRIRLRVLAKKYLNMLHYIVKKTDVVQQLEGHYETMKILYSLM